MSTSNDTGHAKNLANLSKFTQLLATFGSAYNPGNIKLHIKELETLRTNADAKLASINATLNLWKSETNVREIAFEELTKLSTQLLGALQSSDVKDQTIDDFSALVKKMRGSGKLTKADAGRTNPNPPIVDPPNPTPDENTGISTSKQSFDNKLEHFDRMLLLLQNETGYKPNEPDFTSANLKTRLTSLQSANNAANVSSANLKAARIDRNTFFYAKGTGLLDIVKQAKAYIKSVFGSASQQYKAASAIKFYRVVPVSKAS